ncbi:hypothetical protein SKAU_G00303660 [Synaphobranchus kaupii]|uniref:Uncharacterized protein n=1 Tax=Synaphobranchus kaupii TaxID=118154 RepID=A0A9Q1EW65_SYNKA|nr:hypothetical protein SKAU_G00303660 [Synaphobranchus kaupii]
MSRYRHWRTTASQHAPRYLEYRVLGCPACPRRVCGPRPSDDRTANRRLRNGFDVSALLDWCYEYFECHPALLSTLNYLHFAVVGIPINLKRLGPEKP